MALIIGRGVRVEVAKTYGAAKAVTAVTLAKPGVATSAAHGLANKSAGYFDAVNGMAQLDGQAVRIANQATNTFELENIDTTNYPAFTGGNFIPVTAWSTLGSSTGYQAGGGDAEKLDATTLLDDIKQEVNGLLAAQTVTIPINSEDVNSEALAIVEDAARASAYVVFRITYKTGATRIFRGQPSMPGENVQKSQIATGSFNVTVKGFITKGAP